MLNLFQIYRNQQSETSRYRWLFGSGVKCARSILIPWFVPLINTVVDLILTPTQNMDTHTIMEVRVRLKIRVD